jgi:hypothetical protein
MRDRPARARNDCRPALPRDCFHKLYETKWVSYAREPFGGPEAVYRYLGRYTHRVGISNQRLVSVTDEAVTFRTRGDKTATLHLHEFLRRFQMHVLPRGFLKLRHYRLLAPGNVNTKLVRARSLAERAARDVAPSAEEMVTPRPLWPPGRCGRSCLD